MTKKQTANYTTDKLPYRLTNDYLFRAVFQSRPKALEGLCRAVLHLSEKDTISVTLQNPIELGEKIDEKEYILDLAVLINNSRFLNLEMQVYHSPNWTDRSISYTSRGFNNLNRGEAFDRVLPVTHIGFLNYTLFPEQPEFHASYQLMNKKNYHIYSDKFSIGVIDLTQIELATEEDHRYSVDLWARVFTATTWEEIEMLAQNNEYLQEAVSGVRQLTAEEKIRQRCQDRETNAYWERIRAAETERLKQTVSDQQSTINAQQSTIDKYADKEVQRILKKIEAGKSLEQIANELEEDIETIRPFYDKLIAQNS